MGNTVLLFNLIFTEERDIMMLNLYMTSEGDFFYEHDS